MSTILAKPPAFKRALSQLTPVGNDSAQGVIVWSSFFFCGSSKHLYLLCRC